MTEAGERLLAGAREAVAIARGEQPAARIHIQGYAYVPEQRWQPAATAPKDRYFLAFGKPEDMEGVTFKHPGVHAAYWDEIDGRFCIKGATWLGPFIDPLAWMEEPKAPPLALAPAPPAPSP